MEATLYVENPSTEEMCSTGEVVHFPLSDEDIKRIKDDYGIDRNLSRRDLRFYANFFTHDGVDINNWLEDLEIEDPAILDEINELAIILDNNKKLDMYKLAAAWTYYDDDIIYDMIDTIDRLDDLIYFPKVDETEITKDMLRDDMSEDNINRIIDYMDCQAYVDDYASSYQITAYGYICEP